MSAFSAVASQLKVHPPHPPDAGWRNNYREEKSRGKQQSQKIINFDSPKNLFIGTFELIFFVAVE
jgi:hypothetical protein